MINPRMMIQNQERNSHKTATKSRIYYTDYCNNKEVPSKELHV